MIWIIMLATGFLTFAMRFSMFSGVFKRSLPKYIEEILQYVPTAVLSAIIAASLFIESETKSFSLINNFSIAALIATGAAFISRSVLWTIAIGMVALWLLDLQVVP